VTNRGQNTIIDLSYRRLYCDGAVLGKFEVGFATKDRYVSIERRDAPAFLDHFLQLRGFVGQRSENEPIELVKFGPALAYAFVLASTKTSGKANILDDRSLVETGDLMLFITLPPTQELTLPGFLAEGPDMSRLGLRLRCGFIYHRGSPVRLWICDLEEQADRVVARSLRISLMRLQAEYETLRIVCRNLLANRFVLSIGSQQVEGLQSYLNETTRRIGNYEKKATKLSRGDGSLVDLTRYVADALSPGELASLQSLMKQTRMRKNVAKKVVTSTKQVINNKEVYMGTTNINRGVAGIFGQDIHGNAASVSVQNAHWDELKDQPNLPALAQELDRLLAAMKSNAKTGEEYQSLASVVSAKESADKEDGPGVLAALKKAGQWALDTAKAVGVELAAKVISSSMGLG
jgi:hypothetical protein